MTDHNQTSTTPDLSRHAFHRQGYRLNIVHGRLMLTDAEAIIAMWLTAGILPADEARRRVSEVACMLCDPEGKVVGVNTIYVSRLSPGGPAYYFYRTFLLPEARGLSGLPKAMLRQTLDFLSVRADRNGPVGLVVVTENPKLMRRAAMTALSDLGLARIGKDARGCDVWCRHFDGGTPPIEASPLAGRPSGRPSEGSSD